MAHTGPWPNRSKLIPETIDRLVSDGDLSVLPPRLRPLIVLAGKLTREPADVGTDEINAVTEAGWTEETAQDVVCIASHSSPCSTD